jgi:ribosomal protein L7/L12
MTTSNYIFAFLLVANAVGIALTHARRLREIDRKLNQIVAHLGLGQAGSITPSSDVVSLAVDPRQRIAVIKAYRKQTGADLKDAIAVIDKIASESNAARAWHPT